MGDSDGFASSFNWPPSTTGADQYNRHRSAFPDPWLDYSSTQMPRSIYDVLRWSEHVFLNDGTYSMACKRVVRYFLTRIELSEASEEEKEKYSDFLTDDLNIMNVLALAGDDLLIYGNSFNYIFAPFRRYLRCPKCNIFRPINKMTYTFKADNKKGFFISTCENPKCRYNGPFLRDDRRTFEHDKLRMGRVSPHRIRIVPHPVSMNVSYYWDLDPWLRTEIKKGSKVYIEEMPWEIVETVLKDELLKFNKDSFYHLKEDAPSGVWAGGWGIPRMFSNFKQAWSNQILRRYYEAFALDYIIPFRTITPKPGISREGDPLLHMNLADFQSQVMGMFQDHRRDPTTVHCLPFPVDMEMLGAGGMTMMPVELLKVGIEDLLNGLGVPIEFYRGTIQNVQSLPSVLRLFEMTWSGMVAGLNGYLSWICKRTSELNNWEKVKAKLQPPTIAYDLERKQLLLQLSAGQQISRDTAWAPFGLNVREEIRKMLQEERVIQDEMSEFQEQQAKKQELQQTMAMGAAGQLQPTAGQGAPGQPGAPAGGGAMQGGNPTAQGQAPAGATGGAAPPAINPADMTPQDLAAQAEAQAQALLAQPYEMRRSQLNGIKKSNETLHALIIQKMQTIRQSAQTQGGLQLLQGMQQPQAPQ
jgi:hypothetical protein